MQQNNNEYKYALVYLTEERVYGELLSYGVYASKIKYKKGAFLYELYILNDEFEILEEVNIQEIEE